MVKLAVILAAGLGSRLKMGDKPKGLLCLGEKTIIEESIQKLFDCGIENILIGTGHGASYYDDLFEEESRIKTVKNSIYDCSGSMTTLYHLKDYIKEDCLLLESDIIYERIGLQALLEDFSGNVILGSDLTGAGDEVFIEVDDDGSLVNLSKDKVKLQNVFAELVGISKISIGFFEKMCLFHDQTEAQKIDYEDALKAVASKDSIKVKKLNFAWCEIDDEHHLQRAKEQIYPLVTGNEKIYC